MSLKVECCMGTFVDEILYAEFLFPVSINAEAKLKTMFCFVSKKMTQAFQ